MKIQANRKILAVAAAVMFGLATTGGAALARVGGDHMGGGFRGGPYLGDTTSTPSPIFNPEAETSIDRFVINPREQPEQLRRYSVGSHQPRMLRRRPRCCSGRL